MTHISFILDRSGSMHPISEDAIGGFNTFVENQAKIPEPATLSLILFDHSYEIAFAEVPIAEAPKLDSDTFVPRGTTALLDAIGRTVDDLGKHLASLPEGQRPDKVIIAILTDGMENASSDYHRKQIAVLIEQQRTKYSWEFIFLAANQDAFATGGALNIPSNRTASFHASQGGVADAFSKMDNFVCDARLPDDESDL